MGLYGDNGKENGNYYIIIRCILRGYRGIIHGKIEWKLLYKSMKLA